MLKKRTAGEVQPGFKWGPFVMRIPFVHLRLQIPDLLQGVSVSGATGLALVPYFMALFGLSFEEAVTMAAFHGFLLSFSWLIFGDPYAPGWLTPAIPFVIAFITQSVYKEAGHVAQLQAMTALSLDFAFILILLGVTGFGAKLIRVIPNVLKGGIILGAAISAFLRVTKEGDAANVFERAPIAGTIGVIICMLFAFSKPIQEKAGNSKIIAKIVSLGLLPGFIVAGVVGYFTSEFKFEITWGILDVGTHSIGLWEKVSPFAIGWPSWNMFLHAFPLAMITYVLFFGDLVTGNELIEHAQEARPDEKIDINGSRAHVNTGVRNIITAIVAPFFTTQGVLWTGVQVILLKRWSLGRDKVDSLFDSISSFYVWGIPIIFVVLPIVTLLRPLLSVALAVTLVLTAFACAMLALSLVKESVERGAMVTTAMAFSIFEPWLGLLIGLAVIFTLCGPSVFKTKNEHNDSTIKT